MDSIKRHWPFFLGLVLSISLLWPLAWSSYFTHRLDGQVIRLDQMSKCFSDNQIPCRWVPGLENFYGSPVFNYHAPLPYYFGEITFLITKSLTASVKIMLMMSIVGSYIFMYILIFQSYKKFKAGLLAAFYAAFSFLVIIFFNEGVGVAWGLMFFPLVVLSLNRFWKKRKIQNFLLLSISLSLLILSSNTAPVLICLIIFGIFYQYIQTRSFSLVSLSLSAILFALLLSAFYTFPSIFERDLVYSMLEGNILHYLPKSVVERPQGLVNSKYQILAGDSDIYNFKQGTNWFGFDTNTKMHTIIRLSQFYFPNWKIFIDGKETKVEYKNNSLGLMTIILGKGKHTIWARLYDTPIRTLANLVSLAGLLISVLLFLISFGQVRKWITYYRKRIN